MRAFVYRFDRLNFSDVRETTLRDRADPLIEGARLVFANCCGGSLKIVRREREYFRAERLHRLVEIFQEFSGSQCGNCLYLVK